MMYPVVVDIAPMMKSLAFAVVVMCLEVAEYGYLQLILMTNQFYLMNTFQSN